MSTDKHLMAILTTILQSYLFIPSVTCTLQQEDWKGWLAIVQVGAAPNRLADLVNISTDSLDLVA